ncbi:hypothetical protein H9I45_07635 [Polaribacter haliotis]|uniref:Outer membrane protein beta-barrel domain-containing protein n=1 Tax=Polaribacter haliotis TaxID=1888915 RepID=A0A7L8AJZ7_9FLAO|nr:hypothetical protein [Polaribacter haliotis]QOD62303.1 hypothetical protein H9I45_07635 [Polaribacter haliotis]
MKKIFLIIPFLLTISIYGQNNIEISLQQDARLLLIGDKKGNDALTVNLLSKLEVPIYNFENSYLLTHISVEYADLNFKNYQRYAIGSGFGINSIYRKLGAVAYVDFGKIYRQTQGFYSFSFSGELNFKIGNNIKLIVTQQVTQRKDLMKLYNSKKEFIISGFLGLKYNF